MKKLILAIFCFSIINISFSQSEQDDAQFLKVLKEYTLNADGSMDFHYSKEVKLLSHFAFHRLYGETFIVYNTDFQQLTINSAYTIMANGKKVVTPQNAFNEVLPRFAANVPEFNNLREMVVTHTALEVGATIYLDYTIKTQKGFWPALMSDDILSESSPIGELTVKVNIPQSANLKFDLLNIQGKSMEVIEKDKKVFEWKFKSIPASSKDYYQLHNHTSSPRLFFSTAKDLFSVYSGFVNQEAFDMSTNESMDNFVSALMEEKNGQLQIALEIQKVISNNLKTIAAPINVNGFKCNTAIETWNTNKGTNIEKTILLTALLHKAGINAEVVTIIPNQYYNEKIGNILNFDDFLVRVKIEKQGDIFLSAMHVNNHNLKFGMDGKTILLLDKNIESLKVLSAKTMQSKIFVNGNFNINSHKISGKMHMVLEAAANPYFTLFNDNSNIKTLLKGEVSSNDVISVKNDELRQEVISSHLEIIKKESLTKLNTYFSFEIPYLKNGVNNWRYDLLDSERNSAMEIPETIHERYDYSIGFQDNLKCINESKIIEIDNNAGYLLLKFEKLEDKIIITREIKLEKKIIGLDIYEDFREIMNVWNNENYKKLIFKQ